MPDHQKSKRVPEKNIYFCFIDYAEAFDCVLLLLLSCFSRVRLLGIPWTAAYQAPLSMGLSRQEYWSGVPLPSPLTVWIKTNWKILKEMGIPDHLTCLLRNLYAGQEATLRTGHGIQTGSK